MLHFFAGTTFVFAAVALHYPWYDGAIIILAISAVKEVTFDRWVEGDSHRDGLVDWLFYGVVTIIAASVTSVWDGHLVLFFLNVKII